MSLKEYVKPQTTLELSESLFAAYSEGVQTKALLTALGDYWSDYYADLDTVAATSTGAVALYSQEYSQMLDFVLASNIIDMPVEKPFSYRLLGIPEEYLKPHITNGLIDYYYISFPEVASVDYFVSSLFEPDVILEKGNHFDIVDNELRFYVRVFDDPGISNFAYSAGVAPRRNLYLWATNIVLDDYLIYNRYGVFLYKSAKDSPAYHWLITALLHYYVNTKSLPRIEAVLNVLHGLPLVRYTGEQVLEINYVDAYLNPVATHENSAFYEVKTDRTTYYAYSFTKLVVAVGDVLTAFQLISKLHRVEDYVSNPTWYKNMTIPEELIERNDRSVSLLELMDKVLKYNIVYIRMAVTFETYDQYLTQLKELYEIIKTGFPVHLYPFVSSVFEAVFEDTVDSADSLEKFNLTFRQEDQYERCVKGTFGGRTTYYSFPLLDHGRKYSDYSEAKPEITQLFFNGQVKCNNIYSHDVDSLPSGKVVSEKLYTVRFSAKHNYDHMDGSPNFHRPMPEDAPRFNSEYKYSKKADYAETEPLYSFSHNCVTDPFRIQMDTKFEDEFSWFGGPSSSAYELHPEYDAQYGHSNPDVMFSKKLLVENYEFFMTVKTFFEDYFNIEEEFNITAAQMRMSESYGTMYFDGKKPYEGIDWSYYNDGQYLNFNGVAYDSANRHQGNVDGSATDSYLFDADHKINYGHSNWITEDFRLVLTRRVPNGMAIDIFDDIPLMTTHTQIL